jgi:photosystem II stability/assembly factor-like uncharacterized protein
MKTWLNAVVDTVLAPFKGLTGWSRNDGLHHWFHKFGRYGWQGLLLILISLGCFGCAQYLADVSNNPWQVVYLPTESTMQDLAFTEDPNHGWLVGSDATLLETTDGGATWVPQFLPVEDDRSRFVSVSFQGQEGWLVGQPTLLFHTTDGGTHWSRLYLSDKLPGTPLLITALGPESAEMVTDIAAIYRTTDGGQTWQAMVQDALGTVRNLNRSATGGYVAVSALGNFYSTWEPGQSGWTGHNRTSSRRVQNMGFGQDNQTLWMLARGGQVQFTQSADQEDWGEAVVPEFATSWGLLDLAYRTPEEIWISGGSGNLLVSYDGGTTWQKDKAVENTPSNFYRIIFNTPDQGFILGQRGVLLRYAPNAVANTASRPEPMT